MTEETKKLFDAPWEADKFDYYHPSGIGEINIRVKSSKNKLVAGYVTTTETANRLARLPELYDALMVAAYEHCLVCLYGHVKDARHMPKPDDMSRNGCTLSDFPHCPNRNWWNLLKKVRDGK